MNIGDIGSLQNFMHWLKISSITMLANQSDEATAFRAKKAMAKNIFPSYNGCVMMGRLLEHSTIKIPSPFMHINIISVTIGCLEYKGLLRNVKDIDVGPRPHSATRNKLIRNS